MKTEKKLRGIVIWLLITVLSLFVMYIAVGCPALSPEMAMHRAERANLVGPSKVIGACEAVSESYDRLLLGETEQGYCFFVYDDRFRFWDSGRLTYIEKDTRECFFTGWRTYFPEYYDVLPVFVITQNSKAVSARLTLETKSDRDPIYAETRTAQAELSCGVFYQFAVDITDMDYAVRYFWAYRIMQDDDNVYGYISGTATLELFDREGNLLETVVTEYPATK